MLCCPQSLSRVHSLRPLGLQPARLLGPWDSPGKDTGVGCHALLQGSFPTQGSNPGLLHCRWILYQLSHKGSPRKLEWVAYAFSRGSSQPRNRTTVSCIAGGFFTNRAIRELTIYSSKCIPKHTSQRNENVCLYKERAKFCLFLFISQSS